ncbi:MAG: ABC transporter permease [Chloroflexales bacterium]|nr:ABC transporter permease [Chloroflexales bacterium]
MVTRTPTSPKPGAPARATPGRRVSLAAVLLRLRAYIALILLVIIFSVLSPAFLTPSTLFILASHVALNAILGLGMTFVILTGGIDLSVGSIVGLAAMIAGGLLVQGLVLPMFGIIIYFNVWLVMLIALAVGVLVGAINGWIITRFNVAPFIATLGMLYVARGAALLRSNGATFPNLVGSPDLGNTGFPILGTGTFLGLQIPIWLMIAFGALAIFIGYKTPFGRQVFAIGGNERAAELAGVRVKRVKMTVYMISGFCAAMVGLIIASQLTAAHPATGETFELNAIAAVVLGGTSLSGGRGTIGGTILGAFVIGVLNDGMVLLGVSEFWQMVIKGVVIVLAVVVDQLQQSLQRRAVLQAA